MGPTASTKAQIPVLEGLPKPYFGLLGGQSATLVIHQTRPSPPTHRRTPLCQTVSLGNPPPSALGARFSSLDVGLAPASVRPQTFSLREWVVFGKLDANWGEHRTAVADIGARERGLLARFVDWAIGTVKAKYAGECVLSTRRHRPASLQRVAWLFLAFVSYSPMCGSCVPERLYHCNLLATLYSKATADST